MVPGISKAIHIHNTNKRIGKQRHRSERRTSSQRAKKKKRRRTNVGVEVKRDVGVVVVETAAVCVPGQESVVVVVVVAVQKYAISVFTTITWITGGGGLLPRPQPSAPFLIVPPLSLLDRRSEL